MKKVLMASFIIISLGMAGCDRTVSEKSKTTTDSNGNQTTSQQKTVEHPNGSVTTEKETTHNNGQ